MTNHYIEKPSLSDAWVHALALGSRGTREVVPLTVAITRFAPNGAFDEDPVVRESVDQMLTSLGKQSVETVASTIFPDSMWNRSLPRQRLFDRYLSVKDRLRRAHRANRRGLYFERMVTGGPPANPNQLDFVIDQYTSRKGVRRSALQVCVYRPEVDHTREARPGFPCMQQVSFARAGKNELTVNAFYAKQDLVERAYGNYVGLCRLGAFVAHETGLKLTRVTCHLGVAQVEVPPSKFRALHDVFMAVARQQEE